MSGPKKDVFICHASEDKENVAGPLVGACEQAGISCWYDEAEIKWGDSITARVNDGLSRSRYVVVVFSSAFARKNWPQRELNAVLNQEASTGEVKVLPLLVGSNADQQEILAQFPLLNDKRYLPWDGDLHAIVSALLSRLKRSASSDQGVATGAARGPGLRIPLPKIKKQFSQRDRDVFVRGAFSVIKSYFQDALQELERSYQEVQTDFAEVHGQKFLSTVYLRGEVANRCKIWIGGLISTDSIAYQEGEFSIDTDNSLNDSLSVTDDGESLGLRPSGMWFGGQKYAKDEPFSAERAAEYLWSRFTDKLG
jgi:hypothetical protein